MAGSTQTTNQSGTTSSSPWAPQQQYLLNAFSGAQNAFNTANNNASGSTYGAPTAFTAGMTPQQMALFNSMVGYGMNNGIPGQQSAAGTTALGQGQNATGQALGGLSSFNPFATNNVGADVAGGNAYAAGANIPAQVQAAMFPAVQTANQVTLPGIDSAAAAGGNTNSSKSALAQGLVQQGLAQNAQNLAANLQANYYNTGAGLAANSNQANNAAALTGLEGLGQLGGANSQLGLGALSSAIGNQGNLFNTAASGGAGLQQANQLGLTNQQQAWQFGQNSPFAALDNYYNLIGSNNWGNQGTYQGTSQTTSTPSLLSQIMGGVGMAASLATGIPMGGSFGGGSNPFSGGGGSFVNGTPVGSVQMNPLQQYMLAGGGY